ncbi:PTS sugar transporter subunit IIA [Clostridium tarantellae]|uniref:PTS sugar transporter n=1 Tax=Clostridium tarantellae TaxID=39493 RepID=A0A6I1MMP8_9CLOT|nr:PTS sugar transporter subunit IIA [Clostridium tarantellae]MPQ43738.1 PTS sugar transporter [Clostridium tarantellae]
MIGVLIATHGEMAKGIADAIDMICGKQEQFDYISLHRGQDAEEFGALLEEKVELLNSGDGVVVMVDLLGATPMNQSALLLYKKEDIQVVTGINLPMVTVAVMERDMVSNLEELVERMTTDSKESILNVRQLLNV